MNTYAVIEDGVVVNTIMAESLVIAEEVTGKTCIEFTADNPAVIGNQYISSKNYFVQKQPYTSWILSSDYIWEPPTSKPNDNKSYIWDEETTSWIEVTE